MFPLSLFLFLVSEHFPYLLLVSVLVFLDSLHPVFLVFLHLDSPAVPVSDLVSPAVPASDLHSLASAPALAVLRCIPSDLLLDDLQSRPKLLYLLPKSVHKQLVCLLPIFALLQLGVRFFHSDLLLGALLFLSKMVYYYYFIVTFFWMFYCFIVWYVRVTHMIVVAIHSIFFTMSNPFFV